MTQKSVNLNLYRAAKTRVHASEWGNPYTVYHISQSSHHEESHIVEGV